ncbi:exported hypothetical protein [Mesorhizobium metallidurans STM 2683]|uniref:Uncharacterized protein n=1 Tax=Mesorhizobium metallidurans STM 2683 TaxID=1297569 RepID=M5EP56_9HYPH|nr:exported hypothetical protein [Mesorhizobium metallidurans STM 2683]
MRGIFQPTFRLAVVKFKHGMSALSDVLESTLALVIALACCLPFFATPAAAIFYLRSCQASIPVAAPKTKCLRALPQKMP